jgi:hypothetical protein
MSAAWLFSRTTDTLAFVGTAVVSFALAWALPDVGVAADTPPWAWLVFVVFLDVAHVWSTLFRTYLDGDELRRRPLLYAAAPLVAYALGVAAHALSADLFWRVLAYVAVWHFVRQQVGWMTLYGRRSRDPERVVRFDRLAIYAATLGPVVWWHANLPRAFWWFKEHDFISGLPSVAGTVALALHFAVLGAWLVFNALTRRLHLGKLGLLFATWLAWFGGIVLAQSDLAFTVMNVALHGVPYLVLTRRYAVHREAEAGFGPVVRAVLRLGVAGFLLVLWGLAFAEEFLWDRLVWHDHAMFFGESGVELDTTFLTLLVPLLSLPQTTHYLLDGFVWKPSGDPLLVKRLGWSADTTTLRRPP